MRVVELELLVDLNVHAAGRQRASRRQPVHARADHRHTHVRILAELDMPAPAVKFVALSHKASVRDHEALEANRLRTS